ncbi:MAG TPA: shikimate kinase [Roseiflexaceae bacterium]|nr:shikimate kinase [Roseiflexaceae bacterium]
MRDMAHRTRQHSVVALIGLSGAGKSTVGRALAARLGWALRDTDALVEAAAGRRLAAIFAEEGEARFRALEADALRAALDAAPCVVATGGGIVLRPENRVLLRERALVVWLDAPTETLVARLRAHDEERPLLAGDDPAARLEALRAARAGLYAGLADLTLATAGIAAEAICDAIVDRLGSG